MYVVHFIITTLVLLLACVQNIINQQSAAKYEVMFYNLENFFDTIKDKTINDSEYLPTSEKKWNTAKFNTKLTNINRVINGIGNIPEIIGFCEFENKSILASLIKSNAALKKFDIVHYESPDNRGIDVGLIYDSTIFKLLESRPIYVQLGINNDSINALNPKQGLGLINQLGDGRTRNILEVKLKRGQDTFVVYVNHFPSRRNGKEQSAFKRKQVAMELKKAINLVQHSKPNYKIIIMGDFNDEPMDESIFVTLGACGQADSAKCGLLNLFYDYQLKKEGSYCYRDQWNMLDQIIVSNNMKNRVLSTAIFKKDWLLQSGKYEGYPLRTFAGNLYLAGFSDHLPVIANFKF